MGQSPTRFFWLIGASFFPFPPLSRQRSLRIQSCRVGQEGLRAPFCQLRVPASLPPFPQQVRLGELLQRNRDISIPSFKCSLCLPPSLSSLERRLSPSTIPPPFSVLPYFPLLPLFSSLRTNCPIYAIWLCHWELPSSFPCGDSGSNPYILA